MDVSNHKQIYIGPYLRIPVPQMTVERTGPVACCGKNPTGKFCASCGRPAEYKAAPVLVDAVSQGDLAQEINERLSYLSDAAGQGRDGFDYWYPNGGYAALGVPDADRVGAQELNATKIQRSLVVFQTAFGKEVVTLVKAYNATADYQYGLLVWWS
jgi:hypothetical protein